MAEHNASLVTTIVCWRCEAELEATAEVCRQCGAPTSTHAATDMPGDSLPAAARSKDRLLDRPWMIAAVLLHVGVLGIPLYWQTKYSTGVRVCLVAISIVYTLLAVGAIALGIAKIVELMEVLMATSGPAPESKLQLQPVLADLCWRKNLAGRS